jgi:hypothetical protein
MLLQQAALVTEQEESQLELSSDEEGEVDEGDATKEENAGRQGEAMKRPREKVQWPPTRPELSNMAATAAIAGQPREEQGTNQSDYHSLPRTELTTGTVNEVVVRAAYQREAVAEAAASNEEWRGTGGPGGKEPGGASGSGGGRGGGEGGGSGGSVDSSSNDDVGARVIKIDPTVQMDVKKLGGTLSKDASFVLSFLSGQVRPPCMLCDCPFPLFSFSNYLLRRRRWS